MKAEKLAILFDPCQSEVFLSILTCHIQCKHINIHMHMHMRTHIHPPQMSIICFLSEAERQSVCRWGSRRPKQCHGSAMPADGSIFLRLGFISRQMAHRIMNWHSITAYAEYAGWAAAGLLTLLALTAILVVIIKGRRRTSQARAARALLGAEQIDQTPVHSSCTSMASDHTSILQSEPALAFSPKVPRGIRVMYPVFAVLCFWLYIWADLSVAAEVNADLEVAGAPQGDWEWSGTMSTLTLIPAAKDAWNSGAKATAILLGLLNGVWPFCQTLVLLTLGLFLFAFVWIVRSNCVNQTVPRLDVLSLVHVISDSAEGCLVPTW